MFPVFSMMQNIDEYKKWLAIIDAIRTNHAKDVILIHNHIPDEIREIIELD